ncbi:MAG: rod shape-determining protein MreC, partial [Bacteroidales bacterium]
MRTILKFIIKQHNLLFFLVLAIFSFILTIKNNDYQKAISVNFMDEITGNIHNSYYSFMQYLNTVNENKKLAAENALLRKMILNNKDSNQIKIQTNNIYDLIVANVIYATVSKANNYIIINKGSNDSVKPDMAVICPEGVVGIVKNTSPHFSTVIPIINVNAHISARIKSNHFFGTTTWDGINSSVVNLSDIPYHVKLHIGDTVITSGFSAIFPENITIGTIIHFDFSEGSDFYNIKVKISTDFNKLNYVY